MMLERFIDWLRRPSKNFACELDSDKPCPLRKSIKVRGAGQLVIDSIKLVECCRVKRQLEKFPEQKGTKSSSTQVKIKRKKNNAQSNCGRNR